MTTENGNNFDGAMPVRRTSLVNLILDRLRELIASQGLRPGNRLPPERQLAKQLNVSRPSLRAALDLLSQRGALRRVQGGGTYLQPNFATILAEVQETAGVDESTFPEVVEARRCLEPMLVELVAEKANSEQIESLRLEVMEAGENLDDVLAWHQHDLRFHTQLARLSGNSILSATLESLFPRVLASWQANPERFDIPMFHADHLAVVDALSNGKGTEAAEVMRRHLKSFQQALEQSLTMPE